jgi:hypothetical protein
VRFMPVGFHPWREKIEAFRPWHIHIGIMVAGHKAHLFWRPETLHPACGVLELVPGCDVDGIAREGNVIGLAGDDAGLDGVCHSLEMPAPAIEEPGESANDTLWAEVFQNVRNA